MTHKIDLQSNRRDQMIDITDQVEKLVSQDNIDEGIAVIYSTHSTAGITINKNADPDVQKDLLRRLDELCPSNMSQDLHIEGNSAAHLKASMVGASQTVIIHNEKLLLGRWRGIYFCEFD